MAGTADELKKEEDSKRDVWLNTPNLGFGAYKDDDFTMSKNGLKQKLLRQIRHRRRARAHKKSRKISQQGPSDVLTYKNANDQTN